MNKTKTKYRNYDGWPELRKRLERELTICESFFEPNKENDFILSSPEDCFVHLRELEYLDQYLRVKYCSWIYSHLFTYFPIIKLKVPESVFESWLLTHSVDELKQILGYRNE